MMDPVLFWNHVALEANREDHTGGMQARNQRGPTLSSRALAMVHIAMHDAYFGFVPAGPPHNPVGYTPIIGQAPGGGAQLPQRDEIVEVISHAAYGVLSELYPTQKDVFDRALEGALAGVAAPSMAAQQAGQQAAQAVLTNRNGDGSELSHTTMFSQEKGRHRPDPFNEEQGLLGARYGETRHFALAGHLFLADPPGYSGDVFNYEDPVYARHYAEVLNKGRRIPSTRTPSETVVGIYWAYDGASQIGTPPRLYNQIVVEILRTRGETLTLEQRLVQNLRLLTLANIAMADAGIEAWYHKFRRDFNVWRPVVGIREHGKGLGPVTQSPNIAITAGADPFWEPLGAPNTNRTDRRNFTPNFPAYPSGHATFGAAVFETVRLFFGTDFMQPDDIGFSFVSDELNGRSRDTDGSRRTRHERRYDRLIDAIYENSISRIFLGVHWRFDGTTATNAEGILSQTDNIGGVPLGRAIAKQVFQTLEGERTGGPAIEMQDFSVFMQNRLQFSSCDAPSIPTEDRGTERLQVELRGDHLLIAQADNMGNTTLTIVARRSGSTRASLRFDILDTQPPGLNIPPDQFFAGNGVAVLSMQGQRRRLYVHGTDMRNGRCNGWIFNALEE